MTAGDSLKVDLTTVTPIWTGGVDGKSNKNLHLTGIMGSLRWWYEVMMRGIGGRVCTINQPCQYDPKEMRYQGLCDVCRIFGATGWRRRFRLIPGKEDLHPVQPAASSVENERLVFTVFDGKRKHKWYLNSEPLSGSLMLEIIPTAPLDENGKTYLDPRIIGGLIQFIADRASLGAKPQMGLGVIRLKDRQDTQPFLNHLNHVIALHAANNDTRSTEMYDFLPSLHTMFFAKVKVDGASATELETFKLKLGLRDEFRIVFPGDTPLRHTIMGVVEKANRRERKPAKRIGAKIMMSYPYEENAADDYRAIRVWGWVPLKTSSRPSRFQVQNDIYSFLKRQYGKRNEPFWRTYNPGSAKYNGVPEYIQKYLLEVTK